jgi:hypothetical protein
MKAQTQLGGTHMKKLTQTAKRLDIFFRIFQIASNIAWVGSLVGVGIAALGVCFRLDPNMVGTGYNSLELGFAELEVAADFAPDERMVLIQVGVVLALCAVFMLVAWKGCKEIRNILAPMIQGEPFQGIVGQGLKKLARYSIALGIIGNVTILAEQIFTTFIFDLSALLLSEKISHISFNYEIDLTFLVVAAVLLLTSYIFRYGEELQQLSDETL